MNAIAKTAKASRKPVAAKPAKATSKAKVPAKAEPLPDAIIQSSATKTGQHMIKAASGKTFTFSTRYWAGNVRDKCGIGQSFAEAKALVESLPALPAAKLARGVDSHTAPHSAKSVGDAARKERAANKADAVAAKGKAKVDAKAVAKAEARKSERESWKEDRPYKAILKTGEIVAREGTWRRAMLECVASNSTTAAANACMAKNREFGKTHKIDWRWCKAQGYIAI